MEELRRGFVELSDKYLEAASHLKEYAEKRANKLGYTFIDQVAALVMPIGEIYQDAERFKSLANKPSNEDEIKNHISILRQRAMATIYAQSLPEMIEIYNKDIPKTSRLKNAFKDCITQMHKTILALAIEITSA